MSGKGFLRTVAAAVLLLAFVVPVVCLGCGGGGDTITWEEMQSEHAELPDDAGDEENGARDQVSRDTETVHMCGRSVLGGWFEHWGWDYDYDDPQSFGSYRLVYHEMDVPPGIVDTAKEAARDAAESGDGMMFFKLCFDDFVGGDEGEARENLQENERMVSDIAEAAVGEEGLNLIIGNALPKVREYTDEWLVWNHREYNRFLEELARAYGGRLLVLDLYGALSAPEGWLRPAYAADPYDSHLSEEAYDALDEKLAEILR